jgi:hypothetical protein
VQRQQQQQQQQQQEAARQGAVWRRQVSACSALCGANSCSSWRSSGLHSSNLQVQQHAVPQAGASSGAMRAGSTWQGGSTQQSPPVCTSLMRLAAAGCTAAGMVSGGHSCPVLGKGQLLTGFPPFGRAPAQGVPPCARICSSPACPGGVPLRQPLDRPGGPCLAQQQRAGR